MSPADADRRRTFTVDPAVARGMRLGVWFFGIVAVAYTALVLIPDDGKPQTRTGLLVVAAFGVALFGGLAWYSYRVVRRLPDAGVSVDDDGLWPTSGTKERGLVPFTTIAGVRERAWLQRLDLLDARGVTLARLEYQLDRFDELRRLVVDRVLHQRPVMVPATFVKRRGYHVFHLASAAVFACLGWYVGRTHPVFGYAAMIAVVLLVGFEYVTTVCRLVVDHDGLELAWPFHSRRVAWREIEAVELADPVEKGFRYPEVRVRPAGARKPIAIKRLGVDAVNLYTLVVRQWEAGRAAGRASA